MRGFLSIYKREIKGYFATPVAYVFLTIFVVAANLATFYEDFFNNREASLRIFFNVMPKVLLVMVPAFAMRLWAEERRSKSIEMLFSLPITTTQAVLGKFLAAWSVMILGIMLTVTMVFTVDWLGQPDAGPIICGYFSVILLAGLYMAVGSFFSALTKNQVIAFILGVVACGLLFILGSNLITGTIAGWSPVLANVIQHFSLESRIESMARGVLEIRDLAFFVVLIVAIVFCNIVVLEERKAE